MKAVTWLSGTAPIKPSAGWPLTNAITAGIDWIPIWPGTVVVNFPSLNWRFAGKFQSVRAAAAALVRAPRGAGNIGDRVGGRRPAAHDRLAIGSENQGIERWPRPITAPCSNSPPQKS